MTLSEADLRAAITADVRRFMRDFSALNRLIAGVESSDTDIGIAINLALSEVNSTAPRTEPQRLGDLPFTLQMPFLYMVVCHLLTSVMLLQDRNTLAYQDGSATVVSDGQQRRFERAIQLLRQMVGSMISDYKIALNLSSGYGGTVSEYTFLNSWVAGARIGY